MKEDIRVRLYNNDCELNFYQQCCFDFVDRLEIIAVTQYKDKEIDFELFFNAYTNREYSMHSIDDFSSFAFAEEYTVAFSNLENTEFTLKKLKKRNKEQILKCFSRSTLLL